MSCGASRGRPRSIGACVARSFRPPAPLRSRSGCAAGLGRRTGRERASGSVAEPLRLVHSLVTEHRLAGTAVTGQEAAADAHSSAVEGPARMPWRSQSAPPLDGAGAPQGSPDPADGRAPEVAEPAHRRAQQEGRDAAVESSSTSEDLIGSRSPVGPGGHATAPTAAAVHRGRDGIGRRAGCEPGDGRACERHLGAQGSDGGAERCGGEPEGHRGRDAAKSRGPAHRHRCAPTLRESPGRADRVEQRLRAGEVVDREVGERGDLSTSSSSRLRIPTVITRLAGIAGVSTS